ncbi:ribokinase [Segetibacter aerophilus]|uniref:Ribokinase n=1 Tax=Segetibacter aerophilus TaxID=670293 RepID=A0A512BE57_9BACT|nr:ribokinase [Segetibacter aerophilus]GEO10248.1 ribokinase [Segetibacter aerophilus]
MKPSLVVVGSTNIDMVIKANHLPAAGETILGGDFFMNPGGKGANQAVAAQRLGGNVTLVAKTGDDIFGKQSVQLFKDEGINTDLMVVDDINPSGVALITLDKMGENTIVVASGANATLSPGDVENASDAIANATVVMMQLEIPIETVEWVASLAKSNDVRVILNPAPACELPTSLFPKISIITPNEKEAEMLSGVAITDLDSATEAARIIRAKGVETVIITLGSKGAYISAGDISELVSAPEVEAVDTTAAGDVFNGALAVALSERKSLRDATFFACYAAALSVTKFGAQASAPSRQDVLAFVGNTGSSVSAKM